MKLKFLAAAAALLCGMSAHAGINNTGDDAEVFGVVWDESFATHVVDFGITWKTFLALSSNTTLATVTGSANWDKYVAADTNRGDFTRFTGTRWAIFAADTEGFNFIDGDLNLLTTSTLNAKPPFMNDSVESTVYAMGNEFVGTSNQNGLTPDVTKNGDLFASVGSPAHFTETYYYGQTGHLAGNAIGTDLADVFACTTSGFNAGDPANCAKSTVQVGFDGASFTAVTTPIPEPGTYALLLAGLATIGFTARRRLLG